MKCMNAHWFTSVVRKINCANTNVSKAKNLNPEPARMDVASQKSRLCHTLEFCFDFLIYIIIYTYIYILLDYYDYPLSPLTK